MVGFAGIGGIGSNVARHLAQAGVQHIKIVDFDYVEASNLNRQFYLTSQVGQKKTDSLCINLKNIFPDMRVEQKDRRIGREDVLDLFGDCSLVVEGFDDSILKKMIFEELSNREITVVSASGIAGKEIDSITTRKVGGSYIVGDLISDQEDNALYPPKIAIVAARMAAIVIQQLEERNDA